MHDEEDLAKRPQVKPFQFKPLEWEKAWELSDYVSSLFEQNKTDTPEFQAMLRLYGREKLAKMWETWKGKRLFGGSSHE
jgi:hypothetical protein